MLGSSNHLAPGNLEQATVHRVGNGFFLHRGVDDDAFESALLDGTNIDCGANGGAEQFFQAGFSQGRAKASNLGGIAGWTWLEILKACKVPPIDVLSKALHQFFVAEIETVLEQAQGDHQAHGQSGTTGMAGIAAADSDNGTKQVGGLFGLLEWALFVGKLGCQSRLHLVPRQTGPQNSQWMAGLNHLVKAVAKEVVSHCQALQNISGNSQVLKQYFVIPGSFALPHLP